MRAFFNLFIRFIRTRTWVFFILHTSKKKKWVEIGRKKLNRPVSHWNQKLIVCRSNPPSYLSPLWLTYRQSRASFFSQRRLLSPTGSFFFFTIECAMMNKIRVLNSVLVCSLCTVPLPMRRECFWLLHK